MGIRRRSQCSSSALNAKEGSAETLHTHHDTARFLVEDKQAHSLLIVKANQPSTPTSGP
jgi:hypothetical protein